MLDGIDQFIINNCIKNRSLEDIAESIGYDSERMERRLQTLRDKGINAFPGMNGRLLNANDLKICELLSQNMKIDDVAKTLKIQPDTVVESIRKFKELGIAFNMARKKADFTVDERNKRILKLSKEGMSRCDIAKEVGVCSSTVSFVLSKMGVEKVRKRIDNTTKKKIDELRGNGVSVGIIAKTLGIPENTVRKYIIRTENAELKVVDDLDGDNKIQDKKVSKKELTNAISKLIESKNATEEQLAVISKYYGVDLNDVLKLAKYIEER